MMLIENPLDSSPLIFPVLECFHILGFAFSIGTIGLLDLRLLGVGMTHQTPAELAKDLAPWTLFGLVSMFLSGPMLFASDPDMYYTNRAFQVKMVLLAAAMVFNYTLHRKVIQADATPSSGKLVACLSLALWCGVIAGGIFIGFA